MTGAAKKKKTAPTGAASPLSLPKSNPLADAGLSTRAAVIVVLVPLVLQTGGRFVLPWYVGGCGQDDTEECVAKVRQRSMDVMGNLCFLLGLLLVALAGAVREVMRLRERDVKRSSRGSAASKRR